MPIKTKGKVYKTDVRLVLLYGSETWAIRKIQQQKLHTTEMRMLRWSGGVILKVAPIADILNESRLRWYGHVVRRPDDHVVKCISITVHERGRGRPKTTWMTNVRRDMKDLRLTPDDAFERSKWRPTIKKADPA